MYHFGGRPYPNGSFSAAATITKSNCDGFNPLFYWSEFETSPGVYNWAMLDTARTHAANNGKKMIPRIYTNVAGARDFGVGTWPPTPQWLFNAPFNCPSYIPQSGASACPIPWASIYRTRFQSFVAALAAKCKTWSEIEFWQTNSGSGVYGELYWGAIKPPGYTDALWLANWQWHIDMWVAAFSGFKKISGSINGIGSSLSINCGRYARDHGAWCEVHFPSQNSENQITLREIDDSIPILCEAENNGNNQTVGSGFEGMMNTWFSYGILTNYMTFRDSVFNDGATHSNLTFQKTRLRHTIPGVATASGTLTASVATATATSPAGTLGVPAPPAGLPVVEEGSQTAVINTVHSLGTSISQSPTETAVYVIAVDLGNLASGTTPDILEVTANSKVLDTGTQRVSWKVQYVGAQTRVAVYSDPVTIPAGNDTFLATLKQTQGTGRVFDWAIYKL